MYLKYYFKYSKFLIASSFLLMTSVIEINAQVFNFEASGNDVSGCSPHVVTFKNTSQNFEQFNYLWKWGAGKSSNLPNDINASFSNPGKYTIELYVFDKNNNPLDTIIKVDYITVFNNPYVQIAPANTKACINQNVSFFVDSVNSDAGIVKWVWRFGDGIEKVVYSQSQVSYAYSRANDYYPKLYVYDANGCSNTSNSPSVEVEISDEYPKADFDLDVNYACASELLVHFTNKSPQTVPIVQSIWNYNDNSPYDTVENGVHQYTSFGIFHPILTVRAANGCTNSKSATVQLKEFTLDINITDISGKQINSGNMACPGMLNFNLTGTAASYLYDIDWDFDSNNSVDYTNQLSVQKEYLNQGNYTLKVFSTDNESCNVTVTKTFGIEPKLNPDFTPKSFFVCNEKDNITFSATSNAAISNVTYDWYLNNQTTSYTSGKTFTYDSQNSEVIIPTLKATSPNGCIESITGNEVVIEIPEINFKLDHKSGCVPQTMTYTPLVMYNPGSYDQIESIEWDFESDGVVDVITYDNFTTTQHTFDKKGVYLATVILKTKSGCGDTLVIEDNAFFQDRVVAVGDTPVVSFTLSDLTICANDTLFLTELSSLNTDKDTLFVNWFNSDGNVNVGNTPLILSNNKVGEFIFNTPADKSGPEDLFYKISDHGCQVEVFYPDTVQVRGPIAFAGSDFDCSNSYNYTFFPTKLDSVDRMEWRFYRYDASNNDTLERIATIADYYNLQQSFEFDFEPYNTAAKDDFIMILYTENDVSGCYFDESRIVLKVRDPFVDFSLSDYTPCQSENFVDYTIDSVRDEETIDWILDYNTGSQSGTLPYTGLLDYSHKGINTLTMIVTDINNCTYTKDTSFKVYKPVYNDLNASVEEECIQFNSVLTGIVVADTAILNYEWMANNTNLPTTTANNTSLTVNSYDYISIQSIVTDVNGCKDTIIKNDIIRPIHPFVDFNTTAVKYCKGAPVEVTLQNIDNQSTYADEYIWNFGKTDSLILRDNSDFAYNYGDTTGIFEIELIGQITSPSGKTCSDIKKKSIEVKDVFVKIEFENNYTCHDLLDKSRPDISVLPFVYSDSTSATQTFEWYYAEITEDEPLEYQFFSDKNITSIVFPQKTAVSYWVKLELLNTGYYGCEVVSDSQRVQIFNPDVQIKASKDKICLGDEIEFSINPSQSLDLIPHFWSMGDGKPLNYENERFIYIYESLPVDPYFTVEMVISDSTNQTQTTCATNTYSKNVAVYPVEAKFDRGLNDLDTIGCIPFTVDFINTSIGSNVNNYTWFIDTLQFSSLESPSNTFIYPDSTYVVTLKLTNEVCSHSVSKTVSTYKQPDVDILADTTICDYSPTLVEVDLKNQTITDWGASLVNNVSQVSGDFAEITPVSDSSAMVKLDRSGYVYVELLSENSCSGRDSIHIYAQTKPYYTGAPESNFEYYPERNIELSSEPVHSKDKARLFVGEIYSVNNDSLSGVSYRWTFNGEGTNSYLSCTNCANPDINLSCNYSDEISDCSAIPQTLSYTVHLKDSLGCYDVEKTFVVNIDREMKIDVPSAFTPNEDGTNDLLYARGWAVKDLVEFKVYNRWGQLVFETSDLDEGWDGKFNDKPQNSDTYVYTLKAVDFYDVEYNAKGYVTLLR